MFYVLKLAFRSFEDRILAFVRKKKRADASAPCPLHIGDFGDFWN